ncbi:DNA alkylation repair protein [Carnobacterium gallinarum]|uniref:DNA alkylation repair protein n=1 Tax=Carnobacterium gallinarum TaxID=2749 RepID=UPI00054FE38D|nr:DNA alkylation repair protein [Carnobacterium gallinarum]
MDISEIMGRLSELGTEQTKKTLLRHGANEPIFGVKIGDLKKFLVKDVKKNPQLALDLFATGNSDAQYLAGLAIQPKKMKKEQLQTWMETANCSFIAGSIVASVAAESLFAKELALEWMASEQEYIENAGWTTYGSFISITPDTAIHQQEVEALLDSIEKNIHQAKNRVRYSMNQFVICVGSYYPPLLTRAEEVAKTIGKVEVYLGDTACKVPLATDYIEKVVTMERVGRKRKHAVC